MRYEVKSFRLLVIIACSLSTMVLLAFALVSVTGAPFASTQLYWHMTLLIGLWLAMGLVMVTDRIRYAKYAFITLSIIYVFGMVVVYGNKLSEIYTLFFIVPPLAAMCQSARVYRFSFLLSSLGLAAVHLIVPGIWPTDHVPAVLTLRFTNFIFIFGVVYTAVWMKREFERIYQQSVRDREVERLRALTDYMTGAYNTRFFSQYVEQRMQEQQPIGLIIFDLDGFKLVNDTYGHVAGDEVLCEVAERISSAIRSEDRLVRYGGDEFCVLLPTPDEEIISSIGERCRSAITDSPYILPGGDQVLLSASYGTASMPPQTTMSQLLGKADEGLYIEKREKGRTSPQITPRRGRTLPPGGCSCLEIDSTPGS